MTKTARSLLIITAAVTTVAVYFMAAYAGKTKPAGILSTAEIKRLKDYNHLVFPVAVSIIKTGDMVTRLGSDISSEMIRQLNDSDKSFSHCGIASVENDTVFIYHALGGEFNPDQKLLRETLYSFGQPSQNKALGVYRLALSKSQADILQTLIYNYYRQGIAFDMKFDYKTEDRLYCAEFVAKSYSRCLADSSWFTFNHRGNFSYVAVENLCNNNRAKEIHRWSY